MFGKSGKKKEEEYDEVEDFEREIDERAAKAQEKKPQRQEVVRTAREMIEPSPQIVEREVTLSLVNDKLNYIIEFLHQHAD